MFDVNSSKVGIQSDPANFEVDQFAEGERTTTEEGSNEQNEPYSEDDDDDETLSKRPKISEDEKVQKCRERNRIHARNTRERKRAQMDLLQQRIQELSDEKVQLEEFEPETSVASILMSLSSTAKDESSPKASSTSNNNVYCPSSSSRTFAAETMDRIRAQISATLSDDEELELGSEYQIKDKTMCSTQELETIRRERNRMHAKKTRLRKKKILTEMEGIITSLENDIRDLKRKHDLLPKAPSVSADCSGGLKAAMRPTKFTGFRHMQNKTLGGVTVIDGLRQAQQQYVHAMEAQGLPMHPMHQHQQMSQHQQMNQHQMNLQHISHHQIHQQMQMHMHANSTLLPPSPNSMWNPAHLPFNYGHMLGAQMSGQLGGVARHTHSTSLLPTDVVLAPTKAKSLGSVPSGTSVTSTTSGETTSSDSSVDPSQYRSAVPMSVPSSVPGSVPGSESGHSSTMAWNGGAPVTGEVKKQ